jgi:hypothetical protein
MYGTARCPARLKGRGLNMTTKYSKRLELDSFAPLVSIFDLMLTGGIQPKDLMAVCARALKQAEARVRLAQSAESGGLVTAALVLDAWHRDRRYMNARAVPRAVRLLGPAPSVEALIRLQHGRAKAAHIARRLKELRLVVPCGRGLYKPASDAAVLSAQDPLVVQHAMRALSALLETVGENVNGHRHPAPLIERVAEVPDLPRRHIVAFQKFTQMQGRTFLRTVNDWLESRRARRSTRRGTNGTVRAGIHTYAYIASKQRDRSAPHQLGH